MISGKQISESDISEAHETKRKIQEFKRRHAESQFVSVHRVLSDVHELSMVDDDVFAAAGILPRLSCPCLLL
jgi:fructose-1,6-bisphosphatase/sedoheptulose 1,7-bisphosphatase-like protein